MLGVGLVLDVGLALPVGLVLEPELELGSVLLGFGVLELGCALGEAGLVSLGFGLLVLGWGDGDVLLALGCALADWLAAGVADWLVRFDVREREVARTAVFGRAAHADAADAAGCTALALASVTPTALAEQTANPVRALSTASRTSLVLNCPTSPRLTFRLRTWSPSCAQHYARPG